MSEEFDFELVRDGERLTLAGALTIQGAQALHGQLRALLEDAEPPVRLDLGGVTEIDTAGLQLLLMARRTAAARRRPFSLSAVSPVVRTVLELCRWGELPSASAAREAAL